MKQLIIGIIVMLIAAFTSDAATLSIAIVKSDAVVTFASTKTYPI